MLDRKEVKRKRLKVWSRYLSHKTEKNQVALVETYRPMISTIAWGDYRHRRDLEDVVEVGMLGVLEATQKMDVTRVKSIDAYVTMVARSRMINYMQKMWNRDEYMPHRISQNSRQQGHILPDPETSIMDEMTSALEENVLLATVVEEEIGKLSEKERLVLKLRFWEDWQQKDIAKLLKCSTPNVWYIEKRALAKLAHLI